MLLIFSYLITAWLKSEVLFRQQNTVVGELGGPMEISSAFHLCWSKQSALTKMMWNPDDQTPHERFSFLKKIVTRISGNISAGSQNIHYLLPFPKLGLKCITAHSMPNSKTLLCEDKDGAAWGQMINFRESVNRTNLSKISNPPPM